MFHYTDWMDYDFNYDYDMYGRNVIAPTEVMEFIPASERLYDCR